MKRKNSTPSTLSPSSDDGALNSPVSPNAEARRWGRQLPWPLSTIIRFIHTVFLFEETLAKGVPLFRGKLHLLLVYLAPLWISSMLQCCTSRLSFLAVGISAVCCLFNFTASALLHNRTWSDHMYGIMTKLDYAGIFFMISGCCSPVPMLLLSPLACFAFLSIQWGCAVVGVSMTMFGRYTDNKNSVRATVYVIMGLSNCVFIKHLFECLTPFEFICITGMGCLYIVGAVFYARKSPNLWPGVFGYHELFHFCCFAAGICTFILNRSVLRRAGLSDFPPDSVMAHTLT